MVHWDMSAFISLYGSEQSFFLLLLLFLHFFFFSFPQLLLLRALSYTTSIQFHPSIGGKKGAKESRERIYMYRIKRNHIVRRKLPIWEDALRVCKDILHGYMFIWNYICVWGKKNSRKCSIYSNPPCHVMYWEERKRNVYPKVMRNWVVHGLFTLYDRIWR